jgi:hypothetical protein
MKWYLLAVIYSQAGGLATSTEIHVLPSLHVCEVVGYELERLLPAGRRIKFSCVEEPKRAATK